MEIFDNAANTLGLTHSALCQFSSIFVHIGYQNANNLTALGTAITPLDYLVRRGLLRSTNTKAGITYPLSPVTHNQIAKKLLAFTPSIHVGGEVATGITYTLSPATHNQAAKKLLTFTPTATQGSEWNTTLNTPIAFTGPFYGPQAWVGYTGYSRFVSSIITVTAENTLVVTHNVTRVREVSASESHSLAMTHAVAVENVKIGSNNCTITHDVSAVKDHSESPSHTIGLTHESIAFGNQRAEHTLTLTHDVLGPADFVRTVANTCFLTHDGFGGLYLFTSTDSTISATNSASAMVERPASAANTITVSHTATGEVPAIGTHTLSLTHSVVPSGVFTRSGTHTLALSHTPRHNISERTVTNTLTVSHSVATIFLTTNVVHNLGLTHNVESILLRATATSSLGLTHSAVPILLSRSVTNSLTLTHSVVGSSVSRSASNSIALTQVGQATNSRQGAENSLELTHAARIIGTVFTAVVNQLELTHNTISVGSIYNQSASNSLIITQGATDDTPVTASSSLALTHAAVGSYGLTHSLSLSHTAAVDALAKTAVNTINLTHTAAANGPFSRSLAHTIGLMHSVVALSNFPNLCGYAPVINTGNNNYTPPSASGPTIVAQTSIVLTYPYVSPTSTLTLRTPNIADKEVFESARIVRETRGGTLKVYKKTTWPKTTTLHVQVSFNSYDQVQSFLNFIETSLGQEVGYRDQLNRQWRGIIISPEDGFEQPGRFNRTLSFQFEGVLA